jgi:Family of unknown function (DUF7010)
MTFLNRNQAPNAGPSVRGIASGVLFLALFGALWAAMGINGLKGLEEPWLLIVVMLFGLALLFAGVSLLRASRRSPAPATRAEIKQGQSRSKWFRIVFATELITIIIAMAICRAANRFDLFYPVMMLIVGIHFFPLASLFQVKKYHVAGALLCSLAVVTLLAVPERLRLSNLQVAAWLVILGFGGAFILWGVGFAHWLQGRRLLAQRNHERQSTSHS